MGKILTSFGCNVKTIRLKKKLTQESLGELAQINAKYLGEIERGEKNPTVFVLHKLSEALDVPVCKLISLFGCPYIKKD